jgi:hypothetical protein
MKVDEEDALAIVAVALIIFFLIYIFFSVSLPELTLVTHTFRN